METHLDNENNESPILKQVDYIIKNLKMNRSPGGDEVTLEMFMYGGAGLYQKMQQFIVTIWDTEAMPREWSEATICPIRKKGNKTVCKNDRGIALLNVIYTMLLHCIKSKLTFRMIDIVGECGFRKGRGVVD